MMDSSTTKRRRRRKEKDDNTSTNMADPSSYRSGNRQKKSSPHEEPRSLPDCYILRKEDIVFERGKWALKNPGNVRYHEVAHAYKIEYQSTNSKPGKTALLQRIVTELRVNEGANFVRKNEENGQWFDIGDGAARYKLGHCIRDFLKSEAELTQRSRNNSISSQTERSPPTTPPGRSLQRQREGQRGGKASAIRSQMQHDGIEPPCKVKTATTDRSRRNIGSGSHIDDGSSPKKRKAPPISSSQASTTSVAKPSVAQTQSSRDSPSIQSLTECGWDMKAPARLSRRLEKNDISDSEVGAVGMSWSDPASPIVPVSHDEQYDSAVKPSATRTTFAAAASSLKMSSTFQSELFDVASSSGLQHGHDINYGPGTLLQPGRINVTSQRPSTAGALGHFGADQLLRSSVPGSSGQWQLFCQEQLSSHHPRANSMPSMFSPMDPAGRSLQGRSNSTGMVGYSKLPGSSMERVFLGTFHQDGLNAGVQSDSMPSQFWPRSNSRTGSFPVGLRVSSHPSIGFIRSSSDGNLMPTLESMLTTDDSPCPNIMSASVALIHDRPRSDSHVQHRSVTEVFCFRGEATIHGSRAYPIEPRTIEEMVGPSQIYHQSAQLSSSLHIQAEGTDRKISLDQPSQNAHENTGSPDDHDGDGPDILPADWR